MALEREKNRLVLEKCQQILTELLKDEDNKYCVDCDAKSPRWASWNIGIFLCIRCAGIHRNLGVHISKVKSVNLDSWTPQQVACIQQMGNSRARAVYEANLQDNFRRPQSDSALEQFIRAKYEAKKYIAREWVPPQLPIPTWDVEMEKQLRKKKDKKPVSGIIEFPSQVKHVPIKTNNESPKPLPKAPKGKNCSPGSTQSKRIVSGNVCEIVDPEQSKKSGMVDLLGLDMPVSTVNGSQNHESNDIFGDFLAAPFVSDSLKDNINASENKEILAATKSEESSFFNQKQPEHVSEKLSKDSILALYNQTTVQPQHPSALFGGNGGLFMGVAGMPTVPSGGQLGGINIHGIMPSQQAISTPIQQQQNMYFHQPVGVTPVPSVALQSHFFPQGGGCVYPMVPGTVQLSAANPFAQVQGQMSNLSLGGMAHSGLQHQHQVQRMPSSAQVMLNNLSMQNINGLNPNPTQANTLSTNLWQ